jgi:hypothetical protein
MDVNFSPSKADPLIISNKCIQAIHPDLLFNDRMIKKNVDRHKHLGVTVSQNWTRSFHIHTILFKALTRLNVLRQLRHILDRKSLVFITAVLSVFY